MLSEEARAAILAEELAEATQQAADVEETMSAEAAAAATATADVVESAHASLIAAHCTFELWVTLIL